MQTILGSGGAIGTELAKSLRFHTDQIKLVSRNPVKVNAEDILMSGDLMDKKSVLQAVEGSSIVYLTVGFAYNFKVWQEKWVSCMNSVIDACIAHHAKLVFFDNIYMYDPHFLDGMTEETPVKPCSKKGTIRAEIAQMILEQVAKGDLKALIARSADFYGPSIRNTSVMTEMVFNPLSQRKKANWLCSPDYRHSFTYTPDAASATALLGNTEDAYGEVWHLPTAANPMNGRDWIETIAAEMGSDPKYRVVSKLMVKILGMFDPVMREMPEMMYQYDRDYVFNSDKFESRFKIKPTPYLEGIKAIIKADYLR